MSLEPFFKSEDKNFYLLIGNTMELLTQFEHKFATAFAAVPATTPAPLAPAPATTTFATTTFAAAPATTTFAASHVPTSFAASHAPTTFKPSIYSSMKNGSKPTIS